MEIVVDEIADCSVYLSLKKPSPCRFIDEFGEQLTLSDGGFVLGGPCHALH